MTDRSTMTMRDVNHTHPTHETRDFHWFRRGPAVATDGGRAESEHSVEPNVMRDVSHSAPDGVETDRVWDGVQVREPDDE